MILHLMRQVFDNHLFKNSKTSPPDTTKYSFFRSFVCYSELLIIFERKGFFRPYFYGLKVNNLCLTFSRLVIRLTVLFNKLQPQTQAKRSAFSTLSTWVAGS